MPVPFVALGAPVPLAVWLRGGDLFGKRVWLLVGFLPFVPPAAPQLDVAVVSSGLGRHLAIGHRKPVIDEKGTASEPQIEIPLCRVP